MDRDLSLLMNSFFLVNFTCSLPEIQAYVADLFLTIIENSNSAHSLCTNICKDVKGKSKSQWKVLPWQEKEIGNKSGQKQTQHIKPKTRAHARARAHKQHTHTHTQTHTTSRGLGAGWRVGGGRGGWSWPKAVLLARNLTRTSDAASNNIYIYIYGVLYLICELSERNAMTLWWDKGKGSVSIWSQSTIKP